MFYLLQMYHNSIALVGGWLTAGCVVGNW